MRCAHLKPRINNCRCHSVPGTGDKYAADEFKDCKGKKVVFIYRAESSPLDRSTHFTLFDLPGRHVHYDTNSVSPVSILARQQLRNNYSLTFPQLSIARYSFIHLSELGCRGENENAQTSKW